MRGISVAVLMSLTLIGCAKDKVELDLPIRPVNYVQIQGEQSRLQKEFSGTISPKVITPLSFRVGGTIQKRNVDLGDKIKKGDILASLDPMDYKLNYDKAEALYKNAKSTFERDRVLYLENSISKAEYENSLSDFKAKEAEKNTAARQLDYTKIIATAEGEIASVDSEINQTVRAGETIFIVNEVGPLEVEFTVSDMEINNLKLGQEVVVVIPATGAELKGVISNIGSVSTSYGKTYPVKANVYNADSKVKLGMVANVKLELEGNSGNVVPGISIAQNDRDERYVYVITNIKDGVGVIAKKNIQVGLITGKKVEIVSGLIAGDLVVTDGAANVYEGQKVKLGEKGE